MAAPCTSHPAPSLTRFQYLVTSSSNVAHSSTNTRNDQDLALALAEKSPSCWQPAKHAAQAWARDSLTADTTVSPALAATSAGLQLLESGLVGKPLFCLFLVFFLWRPRPRRGPAAQGRLPPDRRRCGRRAQRGGLSPLAARSPPGGADV